MSPFNRYLEKRKTKQSYEVISQRGCFSKKIVTVVIPIKNEYPLFLKTLESIYKSALAYNLLDFIHVVCVINNRKNDADLIKENNLQSINVLQNFDSQCFLSKISIDIINCVYEDFAFDENQGVGLARKIGLDYGIEIKSEILACLDADTLVAEDYCKLLFDFWKENSKKNALAVTDFIHLTGENLEEENAIQKYQNYMKSHSKKLQKTGTWFYPVALGPTIICTSEAYVACGGMNLKLAGEDFYFLQSLIKVCFGKVHFLNTTVYPSSRQSDRVPFGTGRTISELLSNNDKKLGYPDKCYEAIYDFISEVNIFIEKRFSLTNEISDLSCLLKAKNIYLYNFLEKENFFNIWIKLCENNKNAQSLERAFHGWFDGLKIIRLIHFIESELPD